MKFGEYFVAKQLDTWRTHYLDYSTLKSGIDGIIDNRRDAEQTFLRILQGEVSRCNDFYQAACETVAEKYLRLLNQIQSKATKQDGHTSSTSSSTSSSTAIPTINSSDPSPPDSSTAMLEVAESLSSLTIQLDQFGWLNCLALSKIIKKHDKHVPILKCAYFFKQQLQRQTFCDSVELERLYVLLSRAYEPRRSEELVSERRLAQEEAEGEAEQGVDGVTNEAGGEQSFERQSIKFWILPKNVAPLICTLVRHLPIFAFGAFAFGQNIESVYFDNLSDLQLYERRVVKREGAELIRLRAYGSFEHAHKIWVERKIHHDAWTAEASAKTRFNIEADKVPEYITGEYQADDAFKAANPLFGEVQHAISAKSLVPAVRTRCYRSAFQFANSPAFRMSLDTDLEMVRERVQGREYYTPASRIAESDVHRCPLAVLEVKISLRGGTQPPMWWQELLCSSLIQRMDKFSKYCHGVAQFFGEQITQFPYWANEYNEMLVLIERYGGCEEVSSMSSNKIKRVKSANSSASSPVIGASNSPPPMLLSSEEEAEEKNVRPPVSALLRAISEDFIITESDTETTSPKRQLAKRSSSADSNSSSDSRKLVLLHPIPSVSDKSGAPLALKTPDSPSSANFITPPVSYRRADSSDPKKRGDVALDIIEMARIPDQKNGKAKNIFDLSSPSASAGHERAKSVSPPALSPRVVKSSSSEVPPPNRLTVLIGACIPYLGRRWGVVTASEEEMIRSKVNARIRVDPKVLFANERTFLKWVKVVIWLCTLGAALTTLGEGLHRLGYSMMALGLVALLYSIVTYHRRLYALKKRVDSECFGDAIGPTALAGLMLLGVLFGVIYSISITSTLE